MWLWFIYRPCTQAMDEQAELEVQRMFDRIDGALYDGKSTGTKETDSECQEWHSAFPHIE